MLSKIYLNSITTKLQLAQMKTLLTTLALMCLAYQYVLCQEKSDRKAIKTLVAVDNQEVRGYMTNATTDSIYMFLPNKSLDTAISISEINRMVLQQRGSFWNSALKAFAITETFVTFTSLGQDDYFGPAFYFLLGNFVIVAPSSLFSGLISTTPRVKLDLSDRSEIEQLSQIHLSKFFIPSNKLKITPSGLYQVNNLSFPKKENQKLHQLGYSPRFFLNTIQFGVTWSNLHQELRKGIPATDDYYSGENDHVHSLLGIGYSPNEQWEVSYEFASPLQAYQSGSYGDEVESYYDVSFNLIYSVHNLKLIRKFSCFQQGLSDSWQFNAGASFSLMRTQLDKTYGVLEFESYEQRKVQQDNISPGLGLNGSIDHYMTKHFSLKLNIQHSWFVPLKIDETSVETYNYTFQSFTINPKLTMISLGIRASI
ncbi:MAG: hypothetical protein CMB80_25420 [Flammeovirgaceae bacterium]|nr:hypothetical protein [Flammeovirgaceae bacterium]MBE63832.1 hypothetical protein [Flammeovirgaceae bacterium]HCX23222.1 hypothetical protein [Cytophagales bacterium]